MAAEDGFSERAREGVEHFQAAAKELIAAGRAVLDAVEELIDDPAAVEQLVTDARALLGAAGGAMARAATAAAASASGFGHEAACDDPPQRVQRIRVS